MATVLFYCRLVCWCVVGLPFGFDLLISTCSTTGYIAIVCAAATLALLFMYAIVYGATDEARRQQELGTQLRMFVLPSLVLLLCASILQGDSVSVVFAL